MELGDRMKLYEGIEANRCLIPNLPVLVRIDGKAFHTWTRGMTKPYDEGLQNLFNLVTKQLIEATNAIIGYTQSDEISLLIWNRGIPDSQIMFDGRIAKLTSVLASIATAHFNLHAPAYCLGEERPLALFDCRVWNVPTIDEAANCLLWRELDATRNSIQSAAYALYSQKQLYRKSTAEMQAMIFQKGINWNDYPSRFKRGAYFRRRLIERKFTHSELSELPEQHEARKNPELLIKRHIVERVELPPMMKIQNRVEVVLNQAEPVTPE